MKKFFKLGAFLVGAFFLHLFCRAQTDGFALSHLPLKSYIALNPLPKDPIESIFDQPFTYLGRGAQAYAFVSKDQKYVLKFFRQNRASHPLEPIAFLLPPLLQRRLNQTVKKRKEKLKKDFFSYQLASDFLSEETGIFYLHLRPTGRWDKKVTLYDKIKVKHLFPIDQAAFVLQEKAEPVYDSLKQWMEMGEVEKAKRGLTNLVALLQRRCERGIFDKNPDLETNFGFQGERAIQFDIGRFSSDPSRQNPKVYTEDLIRITDKLCCWLDEWAPELSTHIRQEIAQLCENQWYFY